MPGKYSPVWLLLPALYGAVFFILFSDLLAFALFVVSVMMGFSVTMIERTMMGMGAVRKKAAVSEELVTESMIFQVAMIPLALFVLTSTQAVMGQGLVLGIVLWQMVRAWLVRRDQQNDLLSVNAHRLPELTNLALAWTGVCVVATLFTLFL